MYIVYKSPQQAHMIDYRARYDRSIIEFCRVKRSFRDRTSASFLIQSPFHSPYQDWDEVLCWLIDNDRPFSSKRNCERCFWNDAGRLALGGSSGMASIISRSLTGYQCSVRFATDSCYSSGEKPRKKLWRLSLTPSWSSRSFFPLPS